MLLNTNLSKCKCEAQHRKVARNRVNACFLGGNALLLLLELSFFFLRKKWFINAKPSAHATSRRSHVLLLGASWLLEILR